MSPFNQREVQSGRACFLQGLRWCDLVADWGEKSPLCTQSAQEKFQMKGNGEERKPEKPERVSRVMVGWRLGRRVGYVLFTSIPQEINTLEK